MEKFSIWTALEVALGVFIGMALVNIVFKPKKQDFNLEDDTE